VLQRNARCRLTLHATQMQRNYNADFSAFQIREIPLNRES
jgi:hypothetical protein